MSPLGRKEDQGQDKQERFAQWRREAQAEFERLSSLPLIELATEVMIKGFGPGARGADDDAITLGQANVHAGPTATQISFECRMTSWTGRQLGWAAPRWRPARYRRYSGRRAGELSRRA